MTQNQDTPANAAQAQQQSQQEERRIAIPRPETQRTESSLPGHLRPSVINVPVTPGISREAYEEQLTDMPPSPLGAGYFGRRFNEHEIAQSPGTVGLDETGSVDRQLAAGADAGKDFMRRLSTAVTGAGAVATGSQDSLSDIRHKFPNLSLSGNIISATFTIPHLLKYTKGSGEKGTTGSWVSSDPSLQKQWENSGADVMMRNNTGFKTPPGTVGAFRFVFVPLR